MNWLMVLALCGTLITCGPPTPTPHPVTDVQAPLPPPAPEREAPKATPKPEPKPEVPKDIHSDAAEVQHSVNKAWSDTVHYQMTLKRKLLKKDAD